MNQATTGFAKAVWLMRRHAVRGQSVLPTRECNPIGCFISDRAGPAARQAVNYIVWLAGEQSKLARRYDRSGPWVQEACPFMPWLQEKAKSELENDFASAANAQMQAP